MVPRAARGCINSAPSVLMRGTIHAGVEDFMTQWTVLVERDDEIPNIKRSCFYRLWRYPEMRWDLRQEICVGDPITFADSLLHEIWWIYEITLRNGFIWIEVGPTREKGSHAIQICGEDVVPLNAMERLAAEFDA